MPWPKIGFIDFGNSNLVLISKKNNTILFKKVKLTNLNTSIYKYNSFQVAGLSV